MQRRDVSSPRVRGEEGDAGFGLRFRLRLRFIVRGDVARHPARVGDEGEEAGFHRRVIDCHATRRDDGRESRSLYFPPDFVFDFVGESD